MGTWKQLQAFFKSAVDSSGQLQAPAALLQTEEPPFLNEQHKRWVSETVLVFRRKNRHRYGESNPDSSFIFSVA
jgi:hypothetical protein